MLDPGSSVPTKHSRISSPFCALAPPQQEVAWEVDRLQGDSQLPGDGQIEQRHADRDSCSAGQHLRRKDSGIHAGFHSCTYIRTKSSPLAVHSQQKTACPLFLRQGLLRKSRLATLHPASQASQVLCLWVCVPPPPTSCFCLLFLQG